MIQTNSLKLTVLSEDQINKIHQATLDILSSTGVIVGAHEAVDLLYQHGAVVENDKVRIPEKLVTRALSTAPKEIYLYDRSGKTVLNVGDRNVFFGGWLENLYIYDHVSGQLRSPVLDDVATTAIVCDQSENIDWFSWSGQVSDIPAVIREPMIYRKALEYTTKPCIANTVDEEALKDIIDLAAAVVGGYEALKTKPCLANASEPISPLNLSRSGVKKLLLCADYGIPACYYPMPAAGSSAPCFPAGPLVIGNVEVLAGLVIHQLHSPGSPFIYGNMPGVMDMKTMTWGYGAPEFILNLSAVSDLAHWYNLPVYGTAGAGDSMEIDGQLGVEYALSIQNSILSGANLVHDPGILGAGIFAGAEALVFADEIIEMVRHLTRGLEINTETLAVDVIHEIGPGGNFFGHRSTMENYRSFWYPKVFVRESAQDWVIKQKKTDLRDRLRTRVEDMVRSHTIYELGSDVCSVLKEIVARMKKRAETHPGS